MKKPEAEKIRIKTEKRVEKRRKVTVKKVIIDINKKIRDAVRVGRYEANHWPVCLSEDVPKVVDEVVKYYREKGFQIDVRTNDVFYVSWTKEESR